MKLEINSIIIIIISSDIIITKINVNNCTLQNSHILVTNYYHNNNL